MRSRGRVAWALLVAVAGCAAEDEGAATVDAAADVAGPDAAGVDVVAADAGVDSGTPDAGAADVGGDAVSADAGVDGGADTGTGDTGGDAVDVAGDAGDADAVDAGPAIPLPDAATPDVDAPHALLADPLIGTGATLANVGSAYPGAAAPQGLVKASPDTMLAEPIGGAFHCAGYQWFDPNIHGFSHNHLHGTGAPDYGNIAVMPARQMTPAHTLRDGRKAPFTHDDEVAQPGYYAVTLTDPHVRAELAATTRCAHHRYTFLEGAPRGTVLVDLGAAMVNGRSTKATVTVDPVTRTIFGMTHNHGEFSGRYDGFDVYFTARFAQDFAAFGTWDAADALHEGVATAAAEGDPTRLGAWVDFDTAATPTIELQVCLSYVDLDGARAALAAELPAFDIGATRASTLLAWEQALSVMEVEGGTPEQQTILYTALYHVLQMPTIWSDVDGRYRGFDGGVHQADGWTYVTDLSLWDTFRTQHPLLALLWPDRQLDALRSLVAMKEQAGMVPRWPMGGGETGSMIGQHAVAVAADSVRKGLTDFDAAALYEGLRIGATGPLPPGAKWGGRDCIEEYLELGYCPSDADDGSVSLTLEYAFDDYCMARLAEHLGLEDDVALFDARATNYAHLYHADSQFFRPKRTDGTWEDDWSPTMWSFSNEYYVEGTAWQWNWFVPHDEPGLRALFGGDAPFVDKLTAFFEKAEAAFQFDLPTPYYYHGNEPDMHASTLFARAGRPDLAQKWTRWIADTSYKTTFDGLVGNDDAGTLSAWYAFAAMGLMPTPCQPGYTVLSPLFDQVTLHLPSGDVVITAPGVSQGKTRAASATWNGAPIQDWWLDHAPLAAGGTLAFEMVAP